MYSSAVRDAVHPGDGVYVLSSVRLSVHAVEVPGGSSRPWILRVLVLWKFICLVLPFKQKSDLEKIKISAIRNTKLTILRRFLF